MQANEIKNFDLALSHKAFDQILKSSLFLRIYRTFFSYYLTIFFFFFNIAFLPRIDSDYAFLSVFLFFTFDFMWGRSRFKMMWDHDLFLDCILAKNPNGEKFSKRFFFCFMHLFLCFGFILYILLDKNYYNIAFISLNAVTFFIIEYFLIFNNKLISYYNKKNYIDGKMKYYDKSIVNKIIKSSKNINFIYEMEFIEKYTVDRMLQSDKYKIGIIVYIPTLWVTIFFLVIILDESIFARIGYFIAVFLSVGFFTTLFFSILGKSYAKFYLNNFHTNSDHKDIFNVK